jgi:hypothetical protein
VARRNSSGVISANGEDRCHRVVDPDVDRAERFLDARRRVLHVVSNGDIDGQSEGTSPEVLDLARRGLEPLGSSRDQSDAGPALTERARRGAPDTRARPGDDDDLGASNLFLAFRHCHSRASMGQAALGFLARLLGDHLRGVHG